MAIRALSGVVFTRDVRRGSVTIRFDPHEAEADEPVRVAEMEASGASGPYVGAPCKHVAIRQLSIVADAGIVKTDRALNIDDQIDQDSLVIEWDSEGPAFIREISYLVIGEVG
jgi:hypothetical protein